MAEDSIAFMDLVEKYADADVFRELGQWALQKLMEAEVEVKVGAGRHERTDDRVNHRNGYRPRNLETRMGTMNLQIPRLRSGSYFPSFLEPRKMSEHALVAVVREAYLKGVSTRKVDDLVQALGMSGISKSQVSQICGEIDERVQAFPEREITGALRYLWLDATYIKSRENGHVVTRAVGIAVAVNHEGRRAVLGIERGGVSALSLERSQQFVVLVVYAFSVVVDQLALCGEHPIITTLTRTST